MNKRNIISIFIFIAIVSSCISYSNSGTQQPEVLASKSIEHYTNESSKIVDFRAATVNKNKKTISNTNQGVDSQVDHNFSGNLRLINYKHYEVLFNQQTKIPVWVRYELTAIETDGPYSRKGKTFRPDDSIYISQADNNDYRNSGWSRGHMAPAADFKWSDEAMWDTFYFTNCCPQNEKLNNGQWKTLEEKVRDWAVRYGKVYVVTGPIIGQNTYGTIGANKVIVPDAFFKAIMADTPRGLQTIAFVMYNKDKNENMQRCAMSVNDLEKMAGLDVFEDIDDSIEEEVESSYNLRNWGL